MVEGAEVACFIVLLVGRGVAIPLSPTSIQRRFIFAETKFGSKNPKIEKNLHVRISTCSFLAW